MNNLSKVLLCLTILVFLGFGCGVSPLEVDIDHNNGDGGILYRTPAPKPDCKIVKCGPPPRPGANKQNQN